MTLAQQYRNVLIFLIVVIVAGTGYWLLKHFHPSLFLGEPDLVVSEEPASASDFNPQSAIHNPQSIVVHVAGAVESPGVYRLPMQARVIDAVDKAGGGTENADVHRLNLAAKLHDGQQIYVPVQMPEGEPGVPTETGNSHQSAIRSEFSSHRPSGFERASPFSDENKKPRSAIDSLINLNTATGEQLQTLPRIGPATARRIIEYRQTHGPFATVEDLANVKGIGEKTLERIRDLVVVY